MDPGYLFGRISIFAQSIRRERKQKKAGDEKNPTYFQEYDIEPSIEKEEEKQELEEKEQSCH